MISARRWVSICCNAQRDIVKPLHTKTTDIKRTIKIKIITPMMSLKHSLMELAVCKNTMIAMMNLHEIAALQTTEKRTKFYLPKNLVKQ